MAFSFFKKRASKPVLFQLKNEEQFFDKITVKADDVTKDFAVLLSENCRYIMYRDGQFFGEISSETDKIYPFSSDITKKGTNKEKQLYIGVELVCINRQLPFLINWGSVLRYTIEEPNTNKVYSFGASGKFYVNVDFGNGFDAFYRRVLDSKNPNEFDTYELENLLRKAFLVLIHNSIAEGLEQSGKSFDEYKQAPGILPLERQREMSEWVRPAMEKFFGDLGLSIDKEKTQNAMVSTFVMDQIR